VKDYVQLRKLSQREMFVPLEHPPGFEHTLLRSATHYCQLPLAWLPQTGVFLFCPTQQIFRRFHNMRAGMKVLLALVLVLSVFSLTAMAGEWTGYISDSKCGAKGAKDEHADCAVKCVKGGASPVFVTGDKIYKIDDASKVQDHIGHKVTITGELKGDTVQVETVKM
jgi:hypothetical protein